METHVKLILFQSLKVLNWVNSVHMKVQSLKTPVHDQKYKIKW